MLTSQPLWKLRKMGCKTVDDRRSLRLTMDSGQDIANRRPASNVQRLTDLIFYSNFWIGLCATAMVLQTEFLLTGEFMISPLAGMVFFSTLFLYAIHRVVGLNKVQPFTEKGRYQVISQFKSHIVFYAFVAAVGAFYFFIKVSWEIRWALLIPAIISLGYVIPFLNGKRRLRDIGMIKIFLVAVVWAWVSVFLPFLELNQKLDSTFIIMFLERAFFIFAITLPFDIRDLKVDAHNGVKTIPSMLGIQKTKWLAAVVLLFFIGFAGLLFNQNFYSFSTFLALIISGISTYIFIHFSDKTEHDYFFTGLMDGTMVLQFLLVFCIA